jgi:hypothetical protein
MTDSPPAKRNKIKWNEFVGHSKVAGVDIDKAKFSSEAREIGSRLYLAFRL